ncbi:MAG TPA: C45 family peptidase [Mycobacteriales bacterium]|nr:C45 family peptidase [Mycobacteriales bacterium]
MTRQLKVITLNGDGRTRGRQYGEEARGLIHEALAAMEAQLASGSRLLEDVDGSKAAVAHARAGRDHRTQVRRFIADTRFHRDIEAWAPDLLNETIGIAEGANVPWERVFALQLLDEIWAYEAGPTQAVRDLRRGCTSLAVAAVDGRPALLGQNLDVASWMDGLQLVLRIHDGDTEIHGLVYTMAGMIGANGLNSRGLGVGVNGLTQLTTAPRGLPVAFVVRALLAQPSLRAARRYIAAIPHATGQHYLLASPEGIAGFECSANQVSAIDEAPYLVHTNHPLTSTDHAYDLVPDRERARADSGPRLDFVSRHLADGTEWTVQRMQQLLADRTVPLCRIPDGRVEDFTFASTVMELGAQPRMSATTGPPSTEPFTVLDLN